MNTASKSYEELVLQVEQELLREMQYLMSDKADFRKFAQDTLDANRAKEQWELLSQFLSDSNLSSVNPPTLLEVGSGFGTFASYASKQGNLVYGIEPDPSRIEISHALFQLNSNKGISIVNTPGEKIPFPDNYFDIVYSSNVLEHVRDPQLVLSEAIRVLKPNGILQFVIPNYGSWWEGHYGLLWPPNMSKLIARMYVKLFGRDPSYIDSLQFINRFWLENMLSEHRAQIDILSWGDEIWESRLRNMAFSEWATLGALKSIVHWVHKLNLVEFVLWIGKQLHWETPFVLTLRKRDL